MSTLSAIQRFVGVDADGIWGRKTQDALAYVLHCPSTARGIQEAVGVRADGMIGSRTLEAVVKKFGINLWPTQAEVRSGKSVFGAPGDEDNLRAVHPLYPLYYEGKPITHLRCHRLIMHDLEQIFKEVLSAYGLKKIHELGLDQYSGCYNNRSTTTGKAKSMHAWGIAFDWAAETNTYSMKEGKATLSRPECRRFWEIWERHGAVSLGREKNYDWMHVQFAQL